MESSKNIHEDIPVDTWLLMQSPLYLLSIVMLYLYFVLKLGPKLMEKRDPFQLKRIVAIYNAYQVFFSIWLFSRIFFVDNPIEKLTTCNFLKLSKKDVENLADFAWWYFFSKVIELLDTVFFVLRKKQSQVTFLHVYHHTIAMVFTWIYVKYLSDGHGTIMAWINSFVHIVMYFYYFIATVKPQKYLWWKKYITWLQLIQFFTGIPILSYFVIMDCNIPNILLYFYIFNMFFFIYLFGDFYIKAYKKNAKITVKLDVKTT